MPGVQYYALCVLEEDGSTEIAFFELSRESLPVALGISLYTSSGGELQRRHLHEGVVIAAKSPRDLLEALNTGVPSCVFVDGDKIAGSVFRPCSKTSSVSCSANPESYAWTSPI